MKITIDTQFDVGQKVQVENYRRRPAVFEDGIITEIKVYFLPNDRKWINYTVKINRGKGLCVTVNIDKIRNSTPSV